MHRQHEKLTIESQGGGHEEVAASLQITQTGKQLRRMKPALQRKVASSLASSVFACISLAFHQVPNTIVTFFPARWKNFTIVRAGLTHTRSRDRRRGERVRSTPARGETAVRGLSSRYPRARRRGVSVRGGDRPAGPWRTEVPVGPMCNATSLTKRPCTAVRGP